MNSKLIDGIESFNEFVSYLERIGCKPSTELNVEALNRIYNHKEKNTTAFIEVLITTKRLTGTTIKLLANVKIKLNDIEIQTGKRLSILFCEFF